jgi:uncharacterized protein YggE
LQGEQEEFPMKRPTALAGLALAIFLVGILIFRELQVQPRAADGATSVGPATANDKQTHTITTSGEATLKVKPDSARVIFDVKTVASTIKASQTQNAGRVNKILDALKALKIPGLKMRSWDIEVEMVHSKEDRKEEELPRVLGFRVVHLLSVLVHHADSEKLTEMAGRVLDTVLVSGATSVHRLSFFKKDLTEVKRQAMTRAVEDALANAQALAKGAKVKIKETTAVLGDPDDSGNYNVWAGQGDARIRQRVGDDSTTLAAGELNVTCRVSIVCAY